MSDEIKKYMKELKDEFRQENLKLKEEFSQENQKYWEKNEKQNLKLKKEFSEETQRYIGVLSEDFQHKLDVVVEGHQVLSKKIDDLKEESRKEHEETRSMLKLSYRELDKRDHTLESAHSTLKTRVEKLETAHP